AVAGCSSSRCVVTDCVEPYLNCDRDSANGCEVDADRDALHCGACNRACPAGTLCDRGTCRFGTGRDGRLDVDSGTLTLDPVRASVQGSMGSTTVTISHATGAFAVGDLVLLHQTQRPVDPVGHYEFHRVVAVRGDEVELDAPLGASFVTDDVARAQMVRVYEYTAAEVRAGAVLSTVGWNGRHGGILAIDVQGHVQVDGTVDVSRLGFRGGSATSCPYRCRRGMQGEGQRGPGIADTRANGGGGGGGGAGGTDASGGGGGHRGAGTTGAVGTDCARCAGRICPVPGGSPGQVMGRADLSAGVLLGAGGGSGGGDDSGDEPGRGGDGGGILFIRANTLTVGASGAVRSDGADGGGGCNDCCGGSSCGMGGGGGGAGGTIRIVTLGAAALGTNQVRALGGAGGAATCSSATGGAGATGRIGIRAASTSGRTNPAFDNR
ncbi:MAG: hypothetical protein RMK74_17235, partial [Myxococcales bacterium]|nr:hypothetical protein [Myxococcales bacterium]